MFQFTPLLQVTRFDVISSMAARLGDKLGQLRYPVPRSAVSMLRLATRATRIYNILQLHGKNDFVVSTKLFFNIATTKLHCCGDDFHLLRRCYCCNHSYCCCNNWYCNHNNSVLLRLYWRNFFFFEAIKTFSFNRKSCYGMPLYGFLLRNRWSDGLKQGDDGLNLRDFDRK